MILGLLSESTPNELSMPRKVEKSATDVAQPSIERPVVEAPVLRRLRACVRLKTEMKEAFN